MLPDLRMSIKELLEQIIANKELDRHWYSKERENQKLIKATRKADRDRKRLEQGSNYQSDEDRKIETESEKEEQTSDSYYDSETSDDDEDGVEERDSDLDEVDVVSPTNGASQS